MKVPRLLFDILCERACTQPDSVAYLFSDDGVAAQDILTYDALYQRARAIASHIAAYVPRGGRCFAPVSPWGWTTSPRFLGAWAQA